MFVSVGWWESTCTLCSSIQTEKRTWIWFRFRWCLTTFHFFLLLFFFYLFKLFKMTPAFCRFLCIVLPVGLLSYRLYSQYPIHAFFLVISLLFNTIAEWQHCKDVGIVILLSFRNLLLSVISSYVHTVPSIMSNRCHSVRSLLVLSR